MNRPLPTNPRGPQPRRAAALAALLASACASPAPYVRVEDLKPAPAAGSGEYRIEVGDVIGVRVWNQESMSLARARVREDGKIALPLVQDVDVAGRAPAEVARQLEGKLKTYIVTPLVTVTVEEMRPLRVSVLGEVTRPGQFELDRDAPGLLAALAAAGGLTDYAHQDRIYVIRQRGKERPGRIRFDYGALRRGELAASSFRLVAGDVVVVE